VLTPHHVFSLLKLKKKKEAGIFFGIFAKFITSEKEMATIIRVALMVQHTKM